ncbi:hypothetical protein AYO20_08301 [Fonsecaea nubica]|uniref:Uncharacterized protein n=1 Tax=Fonsecaea nubica TaxID=856822 RepID=A0A178CP85_9EURO|nr:hypothetical protein AYO20_08301 [Fonsecaea nubica]OAL31246.1 hypothetical protein AYO20_08301 [Fonsecaea nubica]
MPTPESELFLRQKPKVPPTFQGVDFQDNEAVADARDAIVREQWVQRMMKRLVGEEMDRYLQLLKSTREAGFRGQQQNYIPGVDGPAGGPEVHTDYPSAQQAKGSRGSDLRPGNTTGKGGDALY